MKVEVEKHTTIDKFFCVTTKNLSLQVDYDDVDHAETDAAVQQLKEIVEKYWNPERHLELLKVELIKEWDKDKHLRESYSNQRDLFLAERGL